MNRCLEPLEVRTLFRSLFDALRDQEMCPIRHETTHGTMAFATHSRSERIGVCLEHHPSGYCSVWLFVARPGNNRQRERIASGELWDEKVHCVSYDCTREKGNRCWDSMSIGVALDPTVKAEMYLAKAELMVGFAALVKQIDG